MSDAPHSHSHHDHDHDRKHQEEHDFAAANAKYFDENVHKFEQHAFAKELASRQLTAYLGAYPFDEEKTVMMDFACGIGMVSRELAPYTKQIVGIDISQGLVDEFNLRVNNQGLTPDEMKAVCVHLKGVEGELDNLRFDAIICGMAYHHIQDIAKTTQTLAFFLKPGGVLLVNDMLEVDDITDNFKDMKKQADFEHVVAHKHGFDEPTIRKVFEDAGLIKFELNIIAKAKYHKFPTKIFIAKGTKPEA
ncbi:hypothetical protein CCMSSC00406_0008357 [Pleurotus cornucopiae]|uniref:Uncharacterized protein n=1 Tax=Pleurotus cornucopiae TaxID=5321 RepID=A0ACB7J702_PLECO|nr:hypothetical protein CCMSSC00406_0008357 [Pleurotus cornucopiae]